MGSLLRLSALLAALLAAGAAHAEERALMFATTNAPATRLNIQFLHPWTEAINQDGKGVIQIDVRDGTAIASVANYYDRVTTGVVQVSWGLLSTVAGKFPRPMSRRFPSRRKVRPTARKRCGGSTKPACWAMSSPISIR